MKVIVLAGEGGTRLFPLSRANYPEYFLTVFENISLLMQNIMRYVPIAGPEDIVLVTGQQYEAHVRQELNLHGMSKAHIVFEPEFKNTACAIMLAMSYCKDKLKCPSDETIFISTSDHLISPVNVFLRNMRQGLSLTNKGKMVLFGVRPIKVSSNYGYMKIGDKLDEGYLVERFIQKPDEVQSEHLVKEGWYWNAGICVSQFNAFFTELCKCSPELSTYAQSSYQSILENFKKLPNLSIEHALFEKTDNLAMVILNCFWNDISSWDDMYEVLDKDEESNAKQGDIVTIDCQNSLFIGKKRLIVAADMSDALVVETDDVILVAKRGCSSKISELVAELKKQNRPEAFKTSTTFKSWGCYTVIDSGNGYAINRVTVNPGESLALKMHYHRSEHWVVTEGSGKIVVDGQEQIIYKNQSVFVPVGADYQLSNPGHVVLELIEVQNGDYIGEDDVVYK